MENTKLINGEQCYYSEVRFSIDDFHGDDQSLYSDGFENNQYIVEVPNQDEYSVSSYRTRIMEAERPIFMRLKIMIRDVKMIVSSSNLEDKKRQALKRLFTDDLTSLIQEASDLTRGTNQTIDLVLKLNSLNNKEITAAGRQFGITLRQINRIRERMGFLPKMQQEKLNSALVTLIGLIVSFVFDSVNIKTYGNKLSEDE